MGRNKDKKKQLLEKNKKLKTKQDQWHLIGGQESFFFKKIKNEFQYFKNVAAVELWAERRTTPGQLMDRVYFNHCDFFFS